MNFILFFVSILLVQLLSADSLRVVGSDWMEPVLKGVLKGHVCDFKGGYGITQQLLNDEADLAIVAAPKNPNFGEGLEAFPLAFRVGVLHVHADNPIQSITLAQIKQIFGVEGKFLWERVGDDSEWKSHVIHPAVYEQTEGVDFEYFRYFVMDGEGWSRRVSFYDSVDSLRKFLGKDKDALILANSPVSELGNVLTVEVDGAVIPPSPESVFSGAYPIQLPFYVVYRPEDWYIIHPLLVQLYSESTSQTLSNARYWPVPEEERKKFLSKP